MDWFWRIFLLLICIGLFIYAYRQTRSQSDIQNILDKHVEDRLKKEMRENPEHVIWKRNED